jgi:hypothetical protein
MNSIILQVATLAGLLVLLQLLWGEASVERTLLVASASGLAVYGALLVGITVVQRVLAEVPPPEAPAPEAPPEEPSGSPAEPAETP